MTSGSDVLKMAAGAVVGAAFSALAITSLHKKRKSRQSSNSQSSSSADSKRDSKASSPVSSDCLSIKFNDCLLSKFQRPLDDSRELAVLVACGSYSPVTHMHLSIFETARNYLQMETKKLQIVGGILSPVHNGYGKASLIAAHHRFEMIHRACAESDWLDVSPWELSQDGWRRSAVVLRQYSKFINESKQYSRPVRVMLICGSDLLESFLTPNLWSNEDMDYILGELGVVCIQRIGLDGHKLVNDHELFSKHKDNIHIVPQRIANTISSTEVRYNLAHGLSCKYLLPDSVIRYIEQHKLYGCKSNYVYKESSNDINIANPIDLSSSSSSSKTAVAKS